MVPTVHPKYSDRSVIMRVDQILLALVVDPPTTAHGPGLPIVLLI
jgi:hypothetical protein